MTTTAFEERERTLNRTEKRLRGYRLTTAEILYHLPDHPSVLQSFVWQDLDLAPHFPVLRKFLDFWTHNLDGKLHSVRLGQKPLAGGRGLRYATVALQIH